MLCCFSRRLTAKADGDTLQLRVIWEWHWVIFGFFVAVAAVCLAGVGWGWRNSDNGTTGLRLLLAAGALLALVCGMMFIWVARSDTLTLDRGTGRWTLRHRTYPWACPCTEVAADTKSGALSAVVSVYVSPRTRRELEQAYRHGHPPLNTPQTADDSEPDDGGARAGLLAGADADRKRDTTGAPAAAAVDSAAPIAAIPVQAHADPTVADDGPNPNRTCHCGHADSTGYNGGCLGQVLVFRLDSGLVVPVMEGAGGSCTAVWCCRDRCGYTDIESTADAVNEFLRRGK